MENNQQFKDKSGDKKFFTITPNMIINGYSATESGAYTYAKKRAGEENKFFESAENTAKRLKISKPTWLKIRDKFVRDKVFRFIGWKQGKTHPIKVFEIIDIWGKNVEKYRDNSVGSKKKGKNKNLSSRIRKVKNTTTNKNHIKKEPIINDIKKLKYERYEIPKGDPPPGTGEKPNPAGLEKLAKLKAPLLSKFKMAGSKEFAEAQEEAGAEIRPSGKL